jgi:predicted porin
VTERDRNEFGAGVSLSAYGFSGGVSWRFDNQGTNRGLTATSFGQTNRNDVSGGISYGQGPWSIGGSITYVVADEHNVFGNAPNTVGHGGTEDVAMYEAIGANYALGPGINLNAAIEKMDVTAAVTSEAASGHAWLYTVGTALNF